MMNSEYLVKFLHIISPIFIIFSYLLLNLYGGPLTSEGSNSWDLMSTGSDDGKFGFMIIVAFIPALLILLKNKFLHFLSFFCMFITFGIVTLTDTFWESSSYNLSTYTDNRLIFWILGYLATWSLFIFNISIYIYRLIKLKNN